MSTAARKTVSFEERVQAFSQDFLASFKKTTRYYAFFHLIFCTLAIGELLAFVLFFSFFTQSALFALSLATLLLTGFSYFVLRFYFQVKKPEDLKRLSSHFLESTKSVLPQEEPALAHHMSLAHALGKLAERLDRSEKSYYRLPIHLEALAPVLEKFSIWTHWKDVHIMKEQLIYSAIHHHIAVVKAAPSDLEAHAALARSYFALSQLYLSPAKRMQGETPSWISSMFSSEKIRQKFQAAAHSAIQEYRIIEHYTPNDPWVHAQLANIYHFLELSSEEIAEYETLLKLSPGDKEILFRLGVLYFEQGLNAKGLALYEELVRAQDHERAKELISFYDAHLINLDPSFQL